MNIETTPSTAPPRSRTADPLVACIGELAARFGVAFVPGLLSGLALDRTGRLPWHQTAPALELLGLNAITEDRARLMRRPEPYPAMVSLSDGPVVIHEVRDRQALVWRPGTGEAAWEPFANLAKHFTGHALAVTGDPQALRDASQPWHRRAREHWFWSEIARDRRKFTPVLVATFIVNLLGLALPLFSMNVYDRVIPNRAESTLWVLALGVGVAFALEYALRRARTEVLDQIGRDLDLRLSQKIYSKILSAPLAERKGHTGNLVARVS